MNISNQLCGLVILILLAIIFRQKHKIKCRSERLFYRVYNVTFVMILLDIFSVITLSVGDGIFPEAFKMIVAKVYLVFLFMIVFCSFLYMCSDAFNEYLKFKHIRRVSWIYAFIVAIAVMLVPLELYSNHVTGVVYSQGPSVIVAAGAALLLIVITVIITLIKRNVINQGRKRCLVIIIWMFCWICSAVVQLIFPEYLLIGYAGVIGVLLLFIYYENPQYNLDRKTGFFNIDAFKAQTKEYHELKKDYSLLSIFFTMKFEGKRKYDAGIFEYNRMTSALLRIKGIKCFKISDSQVVVMHGPEMDPNMLYDRINHGYKKEFIEIAELKFMSLHNALLLEDSNDILELFRYTYISNNEMVNDNHIDIGYEEIDQMIKNREIEKCIEDALVNDRIVVYYQPIYNIEKERFTCAEALVRILDETGRVIPPMDFIPVAERNGSIIRLGRAVFEKVCRFINEENFEKLGLEYIEVNLSVLQCIDTKLAYDYMYIMSKYSIPARFINLEITETGSLKEKNSLLKNMEILKKQGVTFSLDDFGTGQSNLNYIVDMPVEVVKFDKDMISAYFKEEKAKHVMEGVMFMLQKLGLDIVAEGIETKSQFEAMRDMNIKFIQGYYFSCPVPRERFVEFIKENNAGKI